MNQFPDILHLTPKDFAQRLKIGVKQAQMIFYDLHPERTELVGKRRRMNIATFNKHWGKAKE